MEHARDGVSRVGSNAFHMNQERRRITPDTTPLGTAAFTSRNDRSNIVGLYNVDKQGHVQQETMRDTPPPGARPSVSADSSNSMRYHETIIEATRLELCSTITRRENPEAPKVMALNIATAQRLVLADMQQQIASQVKKVLDTRAQPSLTMSHTQPFPGNHPQAQNGNLPSIPNYDPHPSARDQPSVPIRDQSLDGSSSSSPGQPPSPPSNTNSQPVPDQPSSSIPDQPASTVRDEHSFSTQDEPVALIHDQRSPPAQDEPTSPTHDEPVASLHSQPSPSVQDRSDSSSRDQFAAISYLDEPGSSFLDQPSLPLPDQTAPGPSISTFATQHDHQLVLDQLGRCISKYCKHHILYCQTEK